MERGLPPQVVRAEPPCGAGSSICVMCCSYLRANTVVTCCPVSLVPIVFLNEKVCKYVLHVLHYNHLVWNLVKLNHAINVLINAMLVYHLLMLKDLLHTVAMYMFL